VHFPISCTAEQGKFDRAVALLHNFFYPETVKAFQTIIKEDPSCAMAYWGLAMSELPNPLVPPFPPANLKAGREAIQLGKAAKTQTPREAEYLAAIESFIPITTRSTTRPALNATSRQCSDCTSLRQDGRTVSAPNGMHRAADRRRHEPASSGLHFGVAYRLGRDPHRSLLLDDGRGRGIDGCSDR
jgi:hypothetical protein